MEKQIFIENRSKYHLTCTPVEKKRVKNSEGKDVTVNKKLFTVVLKSRTVDPDNGKVIHTGYTPIEESKLKDLMENCWAFKAAIEKGDLVQYKEAPKEALLDSQLLDKFAKENAQLKKEVKELKALLTKSGNKGTKTKKEKAAKTNEENEDFGEEL